MEQLNYRLFNLHKKALMSLLKSLLYRISLLPILMLIISCESSEICRDNTDTPLRLGFYDAEDGSISVYIDSITVFGIGREDSLIYDNAKSVTRIEVPLNPNKDTTEFVFVFPEYIDTLAVIHSSQSNLISVGCGFSSFFSIKDINYTNNEIVAIYKEFLEITNELNEHFKVYIDSDTADE